VGPYVLDPCDLAGSISGGQVTANVTRAFGRRFGTSQSLLSVDVGWVHFHDLPESHPQEETSGTIDSWASSPTHR
jgi:hypothetical protein